MLQQRHLDRGSSSGGSCSSSKAGQAGRASYARMLREDGTALPCGSKVGQLARLRDHIPAEALPEP